MKIQELMTKNVQTCRPTDSLSHAAQAMWEADVGCLPVVDDEQLVVGMITDRDICMAAHLRGAPLWAVPVADAMAKVVFSCAPNDKPADVIELCSDKRVRRVPIVDEAGKLLGLITLAGLAHAIESAKSKPGVSAKDVCATLGAVTARRESQASARMEVEVTRETLAAKGTLTPAPRADAAGAKDERTSKSSTAAKRGKKARAAK